MIIVQSNSLPLHSETFTQPCAEQRKSLVEQTEEITVKSLLENNDIQPLGNKLRFLVAPLLKDFKFGKSLKTKHFRDFSFPRVSKISGIEANYTSLFVDNN